MKRRLPHPPLPAAAAVLAALLLLLTACGGPQVPAHYADVATAPRIYPDYTGVTVPVNIAPLCFELLTPADEAVVRLRAKDCEVLCSGLKTRPDMSQWRRLTAAARADSISVEVFARQSDRWVRYRPFAIHVAPDSIDPWLSYRMISPSYVSYEELTINQRCLETFDERVIADNMLCSTEGGGQCINCHSFQRYDPQRLQLHARQTHGGTLIACDGRTEKVALSHDSLLSAAVYPAWHPWLPLIVYSTDKTMQAFHTADLNKIEVMDTASDLIVYDTRRHEVSPLEQQPGELEVFPAWSADGRWLYFCSAHFEYRGDGPPTEEVALRYQELHYNVYRKPFDPATRRFGERQLVVDAAAMGMSATLPRPSPDGRRLMFTMARYGHFHIWHHDADLWIMDLDDGGAPAAEGRGTGHLRSMDEINSDDTESYHSWSSNGRWVVFSSRRYDGVFTRPFIAHVGTDGRGAKPFELPTADPDRHRQLMKSYNVPELMKGPVTLTPQQVARTMKGKAASVTYSRQPALNNN